ncbi:hypothetical protein L1049_014071 [Liquidambar formosana]|uniref:BHLH domain-containing protein n=1 Tax=Liquidambar formosana TaxID=63359 RepID=A0AAP0RPV8_LIQFO
MHFNNFSAVMESLQGPIRPSFFGEHLDVVCSEEQERNASEFMSFGKFFNAESLRFEEEQEELRFSAPRSLEDKMPFLQMLQSVESPPFSTFSEPSFQTLLRLQHLKKPWERNYTPEMEGQIQALELESCITHDMLEMHSPVKSETKDLQHPHSTSCVEGVSSECNQEQANSVDHCCGEGNSGSSAGWVRPENSPKQTHLSKSPPPVNRERRKRKRTRPSKNKEEVENQRKTHIAVERNRRRQMNEHLNALRSLMPPSYIQRGDQASIIGGAIDFVKELEQLLESLEARKRMRKAEEGGESSSSCNSISLNGLLTSSSVQFRVPSDELNCKEGGRRDEFTGEEEEKSEVADIEVTVIQAHVNLKIQCPRRTGQLLKAIVGLEGLRLTVLHLNITSLQGSVLYSFNLKIEDDCELGSADEIAAAVHQMFNFINSS